MNEIIYLVTRDSESYEKDISEHSVAVWEEGEVLEFRISDGVWLRKTGHDNQPNQEFSPENFEKLFGFAPPDYEQQFFIRTDCAWERVNEGS